MKDFKELPPPSGDLDSPATTARMMAAAHRDYCELRDQLIARLRDQLARRAATKD